MTRIKKFQVKILQKFPIYGQTTPVGRKVVFKESIDCDSCKNAGTCDRLACAAKKYIDEQFIKQFLKYNYKPLGGISHKHKQGTYTRICLVNSNAQKIELIETVSKKFNELKSKKAQESVARQKGM